MHALCIILSVASNAMYSF